LVQVLALYGGMQPEEQAQVFAPAAQGSRKVVLATNIAETSVTINGVRYVVDCGFNKEMVFDQQRNMNVLQVGCWGWKHLGVVVGVLVCPARQWFMHSCLTQEVARVV
jgi:hypothetical protein